MAETPFHSVFAEPFSEAAQARMREVGRVTLLDSCAEAELRAVLEDCDALLVRTRTQVTRELIAAAPCLKVIGRGGVGLENIDVAAARERGIEVVYTPAAATAAVADLTVGLLLAVLRGLVESDRAVRAGEFERARAQALSREVGALTLGIIGLGRIGRAVARRCRHGFAMRVLYNDIVEPGLLDFVATSVSKEDLYREADIISLHVPLTAQTRSLIDGEVLARCKPGALLLNTARGAVVESEALARALNEGKLSGAGRDVVEPEPLPPNHPLLQAPNTLLTPHCAARTVAGLERMNAVVEDVVAVLQSKRPRYPAPAEQG